MKIIKGFKAAKEALARGGAAQALAADPREPSVRKIIEDVRLSGDVAIRYYTKEYDDVTFTHSSSFEVPLSKVINDAYNKVDKRIISALKLAAKRIQAYHNLQKKALLRERIGGTGWLIRPLERISVNAPGFRYPLPSSLLMTAIPAKVAGVREVIVVTPPRKLDQPTNSPVTQVAKNVGVSSLTLVAADIAGINRLFSVGGAQAVAALAYGTKSIPTVDKICGPGNIFVTLAKKMVHGIVGIDGLFGTSEVVILADETSNPDYCASDLLAQAEHDPMVSCILITTSKVMADRIIKEVDKQLKVLSHPDIAKQSLKERGVVAIVDNLDEAIDLANLYAPEHLLLMVKNARSYLDRISNAGCIILGEKGTVALGDYIAGPSHVLPTGGTARFSSPLNVTDFVKLTSVIDVDDALLKRLGPSARTLAEAEGLQAHAKAVERRLEKSS